MFFATVAMGRSEFRARLEDAGKLMFKVWSSWGCRSYAPTRRRGVGPCFLGDADWDVLHGAARHDGFLFARKLHSEETALKQRLIDLAAEA
ncbi:hypothetical protein HK405_013806 [Cladochytrium tenue]|nr:hypothetical protein HK405_013806 [Cladochytrium tenue]